MYGLERRRWLIERARTTGRVDVSMVSEELNLAPETIRRDLRDLERKGLVRRVYGGALPIERLGYESNMSMRLERRLAEKRRIADSAVTLIDTAESVYLDEGDLPQLIADRLQPDRHLTVVTPSLAAATSLVNRENITVIMVGGRVRPRTLGTVDTWAVNMLETLVLDVAFLGANGITLAHGVTVPDVSVAAVKTAAIRSSRRRILVGDSSEYGADSFVRFAHIRDFDCFITDSGVVAGAVKEFNTVGVNVIRT